jgi:hypothetical protein
LSIFQFFLLSKSIPLMLVMSAADRCIEISDVPSNRWGKE